MTSSIEEPLLKNRRKRREENEADEADKISTTSSIEGGGGREEKEIQTSSTTSTTSTSIENICWLVAAVACAYFSDILRVMYSDERIYRSLMHVSFLLIGINLSIAFYLVVWLSHLKRVDSNRWNDIHPTLIPIATACFVSGSILLTISIWPVYTWLSIPLLFTIFMGIIVIVINLPILI